MGISARTMLAVCVPAILGLSKESIGDAKSVLFVRTRHYGAPRFFVDPRYAAELRAQGWAVGSSTLRHLTVEKLSLFNVLVLQSHPDVVVHPDYRELAADRHELVARFLSRGGGLLVFGDLGRSRVFPYWNAFMQGFGIRINPRDVVETDPTRILELENYRIKSYGTDRIVAAPFTQGVEGLRYPQHHIWTLDTDANWRVAVYGSGTAKAETSSVSKIDTPVVPSEPPLLVWRQRLGGRIAVFATDSTFYTLNPYHTVWDDGHFLDSGDGRRLFANLFAWLAGEAGAARQVGGFVEGRQKEVYDIEAAENEVTPARQTRTVGGQPVRRALIGARSTFSGGPHSPKDFCDAAKRAGLDMLVFTEDREALTADAWQRLVDACRAESDESFLAHPGVRFKGLETGNEGLAFGLKKPWGDIPFDATDFTSYVRIGVNTGWSSMVCSLRPSDNPVSIYNTGAVTAFPLFTYRGTELVEENVDLYLATSSEGWLLAPITYTRLDDPRQIADAVRLPLTFFYAPVWGNQFEPERHTLHNSFVSEGPVIEYLRTEAPHSWAPGAFLDRPVEISFAVHAEQPLTKVTVIACKRVLRVFRPKATRCEETFTIRTNENLYPHLVVEDQAGRRAWSRSGVENRIAYSHFIGTDRMNGYWYPTLLTEEEPRWGKIEGRYVRLLTSTNPGLGWGGEHFPVRTERQQLHPEGPEVHAPRGGIHRIGHIPVFFTPDGTEPAPSAPYRRVALNSTDCIVMRDTIDRRFASEKAPDGRHHVSTPPTRFLRAMIETTVFRYRETYMALVETQMEAKKDFTIRGERDAAFTVAYNGNPAASRSIVRKNAGGPVETLPCEDTTFHLGVNSFAAVVDNAYGTAAVFTFEPSRIRVSGRMPVLTVLPDLPDRMFRKARKIRFKHLLALTNGKRPPSARVFADIHDKYGFDGTFGTRVRIHRGVLENGVAIPEFAPEKHGVEASFSVADMPAAFGVKVRGVNPNWSSSIYDVPGKRLIRNIAVLEGTAYACLDVDRGLHVFIGNLVVADDERVVIDVLDAAGGTLRLTVHNPTAAPLTTQVHANCRAVGELDREVTLAPGATVAMGSTNRKGNGGR